MNESTVLTIAHRIEAVQNATFYVRLDSGKVVAAGPADAEITGHGVPVRGDQDEGAGAGGNELGSEE